jgi:hypothetical protein
MKTNTNIRAVKRNDIPDLKTVIEANRLFPSDMLDEMISGYFNDRNARGGASPRHLCGG